MKQLSGDDVHQMFEHLEFTISNTGWERKI